jgi:hypothetical protein
MSSGVLAAALCRASNQTVREKQAVFETFAFSPQVQVTVDKGWKDVSTFSPPPPTTVLTFTDKRGSVLAELSLQLVKRFGGHTVGLYAAGALDDATPVNVVIKYVLNDGWDPEEGIVDKLHANGCNTVPIRKAPVHSVDDPMGSDVNIYIMGYMDGSMQDMAMVLKETQTLRTRNSVVSVVRMVDEVRRQMNCLLRSHGCMYADMKPENVMFRCDGDSTRVHIADMGSCFEDAEGEVTMTLPPPEYLLVRRPQDEGFGFVPKRLFKKHGVPTATGNSYLSYTIGALLLVMADANAFQIIKYTAIGGFVGPDGRFTQEVQTYMLSILVSFYGGAGAAIAADYVFGVGGDPAKRPSIQRRMDVDAFQPPFPDEPKPSFWQSVPKALRRVVWGRQAHSN